MKPYYERDGIILHNCDCREFLPTIAAGSVDLVLTDPPYNINKAEWDRIKNYDEWCHQWLMMCNDALKASGSFYFWHQDMEQISKLMVWIRQNTGLNFRQLITVYKKQTRVYNWKNRTRISAGWWSNVQNWYPVTEYILFFTAQDPNCYQYEIDQLRHYTDYMRSVNTKLTLDMKKLNLAFGYVAGCNWWFSAKQPRLINETDYVKLQTMFPSFDLSYQEILQRISSQKSQIKPIFNLSDDISNVWEWDFHNDGSRHPTEKPLHLIERMISASSNKTNVLADPFTGSGTTAVACIRLGRKFIGCEISERYCEIAARRIDAELNKGRLFEPSELEQPRQLALTETT